MEKSRFKLLSAVVVVVVVATLAVMAAAVVMASEDEVTVSVGDDYPVDGEPIVDQSPEQATRQENIRERGEGKSERRLRKEGYPWLNEWADHWWREPMEMLREFDLNDDWGFMWPSRHRNFLLGRGEDMGRRRPSSSMLERFHHAKENLFDQVSNYMDRTFGSRRHGTGELPFAASADLRQVDNEYELVVDVPGMEKGDIEVRIRETRNPWSRSLVDVLEVEGKRSYESKKEDLLLDAKEKQERIAGSKSQQPQGNGQSQEGKPKYIYVERSTGQFQRKFTLPQRVLKDKVRASLKSGVLTVRVPIDPQEHEIKPSVTNIAIE